MRGKRGDAFLVSRDGGAVRFGLGYGDASPALFDLPHAALSKDVDGSGLAAPRIAGIAVTDRQNNTAPKLAGKPLKLGQDEYSQSLAITPDGGRFVLGTEFSLRAFDTQGQEQWEKPGPDAAWGVNVTGDGRLVLAAYGDGTIRWHRMSDGQELLALFVDKDDLRWVVWTPSGYYMASPGGEDLIGWHVNRGWDQAADFFPASASVSALADRTSWVLCSKRSTRTLQSKRRTRSPAASWILAHSLRICHQLSASPLRPVALTFRPE